MTNSFYATQSHRSKRVAALLISLMAIGHPAIASNVKLSTLNKGVSDVNFRNVGVFQHNMLISGDIQISGKIGPLTVSDAGYGNDKLTVMLPALPFSAAMPIPVGSPTTTENALAVGRSWMSSMAPLLTSRIQNWAISKGVSMGIYNYTQEVNIRTAAGIKKRALMWNISVDKDGKATYGEPKLVNADPLILEANYVTGKAVAKLPPTWKFANGGKIQYRVLDKKLQPITAWSTIDVGGVYDSLAPVPDASQPTCFIDNRNSGCPQGYKDVRQLLDDTGSSFAYINYVHGLVPEYEQGSGGVDYAKAAISVDQRIWRCTSYENYGYYGFVLNTTLDRYFVNPDTNTPHKGILLGSFKGRTISPTEPYYKVVPTSAIPGHPEGYMISPLPGDNSLWSKYDSAKMRNVIYMAPVRSDSDGSMSNVTSTSTDTAVHSVYNAGSIKRYEIGTVCDNCLVGYSGTVFDRSVTFTMANPQELERVAIVRTRFDDWMAVWINGTMVLNLPNGGDRLNLFESTGKFKRKYVENWSGVYNSVELYQSNDWGANVNIKPYLRPGYNQIAIRTIVGGEGEGIIDVEINECGSNLGLPHDITYPPPGSSFQGVTNTLIQKAD